MSESHSIAGHEVGINHGTFGSIFPCRTLMAALLFFAPTWAAADGWDMFGQHEQMKRYVIVDVGEVSRVDPPFNTKWEKDVYRLNARCFLISSDMGYWGYGKKAALLLINAQKNVQLALIEPTIGATKVELKSIETIQCP